MSDEPIPSLAEALTEIRRLRARIVELEAASAMVHGTLEKPTSAGPTLYTHNVAANAPPHNE